MEKPLDKKEKKKLRVKDQEQFVIAIGASAGGLEAIHEFFDNMPHLANFSFIIIQHLSPDYKSLLVELVSKHTEMSVFEAEDNIAVEKNCIYVIPPKKVMTISGGRLKLSEKNIADKGPNTAIDTFLYTLAEDQKEKAVAIILSGTGTDGTRGIEAIKEHCGLVIAQDPVTAKFDGMPRSAIASGCVDLVLSPAQIPQELENYVKDVPDNIFEGGKLDEELLSEVFSLLYRHTNCDFHYYKLPTLLRRIARRMMQHGFKKINEYLVMLRDSPEECRLLSDDFLIGVTRFFRDAEAFDTITQTVIPQLVDSKKEWEIIKLWVTACSSGEEAYSLAILFDKYLKQAGKIIPVKIFATDIDTRAIDAAARGEYPLSISKDVPEDILDKYFIKGNRAYTIIPEIRKQIVFAKHDIIKDPPFIKNDLVSCRNMLIYMSTPLQKKVLNTLNFSLNQSGYLFLGSSETVAGVKDDLEEINRKWKIFRKGQNTTRLYYPLDKPLDILQSSHLVVSDLSKEKKSNQKGLIEDFNEVLSEEKSYAALYIDKNYDVKEAIGNFSKYLSLPQKHLNLNLLRMVSNDLSIVLSSAIRKAWKDNEKVHLKNVSLKTTGKNLDVIVKPSGPGLYTLVVIGEAEQTAPAKRAPETVPAEFSELDYVTELKAELKETKGNLQSAIEELETANEELQSSNEELLSSNEELQSSNEELQSLNEELHTLNTEHQLKITELIELNDDLNNYFRSTDIGQIFLDSQLKIRKFNPAVVKLINLIESDIGRPVNHLSNNILYGTLQEDIESVVRTGKVIEKEVKLANGRVSLMRIYPYIRQDKQTDGLIITFVDITAVKDLNDIISGIFNASQSAIMALKAIYNHKNEITDFSWITANHEAEKIYKLPADELKGKYLTAVSPSVIDKGLFERYVAVMKTGRPMKIDYPYKSAEKEGWWEIVAVKMGDGLAVTFTDITEKRESENRLRKNYDELNQTKEKLKKLNLDLENKVIERTYKLAESEERFRLVSRATNDAIWDWGLVNNTVWLNEGFYSMFGFENKLQETDLNFKLDKIHPDDRARVRKSIYDTINKGKKQWTAEYRFKKADGSYALILDRGHVLHNETDIPYRMIGSMMDITSLRNAEQEAVQNLEQRKFLAEAMPLIVWTADPEGKVNFLNNQFAVYTGKDTETGYGYKWQKFIDSEHLPEIEKTWKAAVANKSDFSIEFKLLRYDKTYRWHLLRARAKKDEKGDVVMWVGTNTDIHQQKLATELMEQTVAERTFELQRTNEALEISNHDLQQFASVASHDLKEPLRKIHMFSNMLKEKHMQDLDGAGHYLDRILSSSSRMTKLINDLLNFSRLSVSNLYEQTDLNKVVETILSDLELLIEEKQADVIVDNLPVIEAIPGQMRQMLQNIISNGLKFSQGSVKPVIEIKGALIKEKNVNSAEDKKGKYCRITIRDNGIGFDEQYLDKIFTIFQRLHTKQQCEGTGIGLAICKKIVDKHNGLITASSKENEGATFTIILPVKQEEKAQENGAASSQAS